MVITNESRAWEKIEWKGQHYLIGLKGCHAKESRRETAFIDYLPAQPGVGDWDSLRPVLDVWPQTQWRGVEVSQSDAEKDEGPPHENDHAS